MDQQTVASAPITVDYTLHIAIGIIGVLLLGIASVVGNHFTTVLTKIETKLSDHDEEISEIKQKQAAMSSNTANERRELADLIVTKMRAASGG